MVKDRKAADSWSSVKAGLRGFDRTALLGLVQDLYVVSKDNQAFFHARLDLGGDPEGMAELSVFYCEEAIAFLHDCGMDDEGYYSALASAEMGQDPARKSAASF